MNNLICEKNTLILTLKRRKNTANTFEKDFFKLMINCVSDKTMGNLKQRISVRLVNDEEDYLKHVSKPTFISQRTWVKLLLLFMKLNQF